MSPTEIQSTTATPLGERPGILVSVWPLSRHQTPQFSQETHEGIVRGRERPDLAWTSREDAAVGDSPNGRGIGFPETGEGTVDLPHPRPEGPDVTPLEEHEPRRETPRDRAQLRNRTWRSRKSRPSAPCRECGHRASAWRRSARRPEPDRDRCAAGSPGPPASRRDHTSPLRSTRRRRRAEPRSRHTQGRGASPRTHHRPEGGREPSPLERP